VRPSRLFPVFGFLLVGVGVALLISAGVSLLYKDHALIPLLVSALGTLGVGFICTGVGSVKGELTTREGFAIVTIGWVLVPLAGSLPYLLSGAVGTLTDAFFESVSGFTTTGASVILDVEVLPHGLLFWRSMTHWLGGMGIVVLSLAILPMLGMGGMQLYKAEVGGVSKDKLTPRVTETARLLWGVYVLLTVGEIILLLVGKMPLFDAVCHSFATVATGGFSTKNASIGYYRSPYIEAVVTVFMLLAGTNFALHYSALRGDVGRYLRNQEFIYYITVFLIVTIGLASVNVLTQPNNNMVTAVRYTSFNVASIMSCTGFASADFALWAPVSQLTLHILMFAGGCAGSTAGGMKNVRVLLMLKSIHRQFKELLFPRAVVPVRLDGKMVESDILVSVGGFMLLYLTIFLAATILLLETGLDFISASSAVATCLAGVGPGLGSVGPMSNYAHLSTLAKWVLDACMLLGRLEIYTIIILFSTTFWKK
jgi:trk system potassium uptake protein TrkH